MISGIRTYKSSACSILAKQIRLVVDIHVDHASARSGTALDEQFICVISPKKLWKIPVTPPLSSFSFWSVLKCRLPQWELHSSRQWNSWGEISVEKRYLYDYRIGLALKVEWNSFWPRLLMHLNKSNISTTNLVGLGHERRCTSDHPSYRTCYFGDDHFHRGISSNFLSFVERPDTFSSVSNPPFSTYFHLSKLVGYALKCSNLSFCYSRESLHFSGCS